MPYLKIDSKNFFYNYEIILSKIKDKNKIAIVLKDNAYGHGILEISQLVAKVGIHHAFVKNAAEALKIAESFKTITILYPFSLDFKNAQDSSLNKAIKHDNIYICAASLESLQTLPKNTKIELKIDSGMHRNGIAKEQLEQAFLIIKKQGLILKGVFTHNGYGDEISSAFYTQNMEFSQIKREVLELCKIYSLEIPRFHSLSSSGALRIHNFKAKDSADSSFMQDDLYRFGIAFYGYDCTNFLNLPLKPIASLYAKKISTLPLKKGANIGYSGVSVLEKDCAISTYDIGYGDGFFRLRENMEFFSAEGFRILPRVSMDCLSAISDEEEICIFNSVEKLAKLFNTIPYEILSHLHAYIPRIIV